jgi:hypothetical protein
MMCEDRDHQRILEMPAPGSTMPFLARHRARRFLKAFRQTPRRSLLARQGFFLLSTALDLPHQIPHWILF